MDQRKETPALSQGNDQLKRTTAGLINANEIIATNVASVQYIGTQEIHHHREENLQRKPPLQRPLRAEHFTDREEEQQWLLDHLQEGRTVTLCGPGGMGKTALLAEVLWKLFPDDAPPERFPDGLIFHSFYQQPEVAIALEQIARIFGESPLPTSTLAARRALNGRHVLLVFDGAEEADNLRQVLETCAGQMVIITSRRRTDAPNPQYLWDLSPLPEKHAVAVVKAWSKEQVVNEPILQQICQLVGNLPLALRLAGRYLALHQEEAREYLQWLEESPLIALDQGESQYESVPVLLGRSVTRLSHDAQQVLIVIGLLAPTAFERDLISTVLNLPITRIRPALNELQDYGLLFSQNRHYEVSHTLIHTYAHEVLLAKQDRASQGVLATRLIQALRDRFSDEEKIDSPVYEKLLPHVQACQELMEFPDLVTSEAASVFTQAGHYLADTQLQYAEAEPLYKRALAIREQVLGMEHPDTVTTLNILATLYQLQGRYEDEEPLLKRVLAIREQVLGMEHPDTATTLNNLASLYRSQGKIKQAESLYERAASIYTNVLGMEHQYTATTLNNLASLYQLQGKYEEAEPLLQKALAIRKQVLGMEHLDTASSLNNLATLYLTQGRYEEAEPLLKQALAICKKGLRSEHPITANIFNNLAALYLTQGKVKRAESLLKSALAIREQVLGMEHPDTASSLNNLAALYRGQGRYEEEESLLKNVLASRKKTLGMEHPDTASSFHNLGALYLAQGKYEEAGPLLKQALTIYKQVLGPEHPNTLSTAGLLLKTQNEREEMASIKNLLSIYSKSSSSMERKESISLASFSTKKQFLQKKSRRSFKRKRIKRSSRKNKDK